MMPTKFWYVRSPAGESHDVVVVASTRHQAETFAHRFSGMSLSEVKAGIYQLKTRSCDALKWRGP